jgi:3-hydroxybutyryl-CoA dehydrogenase
MAANIRKIAVIGAGVMGGGLAQLFAQKGHWVGLYDTSEDALGAAVQRARSNLEIQVEMGWIEPVEVEEALVRIDHATDLAKALENSDYVIEAVPEDLELKKQVFRRIGDLAPSHAVLASNTSTFDIAAEVDPDIAPRVLIAHFFNPPQLIPLVEVVAGERTDEAVVASMMTLLYEVGKHPLFVQRYLPGFVVNRFQLAINAMAYMILMEGVLKPEEIDHAIEASIGLRLSTGGPFATMDLGGLDVVAASAHTMGFDPPGPLQERVDRGELGVKTGKGFYDYAGMDEEEILRRRDRRLMLMLEAWNRSRVAGLWYAPSEDA